MCIQCTKGRDWNCETYSVFEEGFEEGLEGVSTLIDLGNSGSMINDTQSKCIKKSNSLVILTYPQNNETHFIRVHVLPGFVSNQSGDDTMSERSKTTVFFRLVRCQDHERGERGIPD